MRTAITPPTPEKAAEILTIGDDDRHYGYGWHLSIGSSGNVVDIGITPYTEDGVELPEQHFRAVVVEGDEVPIVLGWPTELGLPGEDDCDLISLTAKGIRICPPDAAWFDLTPDEAREWAAHLAAMANVLEAAQGTEDAR